MKVKVLLFGEAVNIPSTSIGLGVGLISVWMDGNGFTSGSNDLGTLGYVFLETQEVDLGTLADAKQTLFSDLTNRVVTFNVKPNLFVKDGGIARISMNIPTEQGGAVTDQKIEFVAEDCKGNCCELECGELLGEYVSPGKEARGFRQRDGGTRRRCGRNRRRRT